MAPQSVRSAIQIRPLCCVCVLRGPRISRVAISSGRTRYITQPSPQLKGQICISSPRLFPISLPSIRMWTKCEQARVPREEGRTREGEWSKCDCKMKMYVTFGGAERKGKEGKGREGKGP